LLVVANNERYAQLTENIESVMANYYAAVDAADRKRVRDSARQKLNVIIQDHKKFEIAKQELEARLAEENKEAAAPQIEEESKENASKNDPLAKYRAGEDRYTQLMEHRKPVRE